MNVWRCASQAVCFASFGASLRALSGIATEGAAITEETATLAQLFGAGCGSGAATVSKIGMGGHVARQTTLVEHAATARCSSLQLQPRLNPLVQLIFFMAPCRPLIGCDWLPLRPQVLVTTPTDILKVRLQNQTGGGSGAAAAKYRGMTHCARCMLREEGPKGFTRCVL